MRTGTINPNRYQDKQQLISAYANDLRSLLKNPIKFWCYGHTHYPAILSYRNVKIVSNPHGYRNEKVGYNPTLFLSV